MADNTFDAIVVGSGISGGWAAMELTKLGMKTIMLERGRDIKHVKDYTNASKDVWEFPHHGRRTQQMIEDYPVLKRDYPLSEETLDYWVKDKECPYTETKPFSWFRGYHVGGRSLMWGRQSYRWNKWDFEANLRDGHGVDWPIRYDDLAPWYSYAEKFAGIQGSKQGLDVLPDGEFLPAMDLNVVEKDVADRGIIQFLCIVDFMPTGNTGGMIMSNVRVIGLYGVNDITFIHLHVIDIVQQFEIV